MANYAQEQAGNKANFDKYLKSKGVDPSSVSYDSLLQQLLKTNPNAINDPSEKFEDGTRINAPQTNFTIPGIGDVAAYKDTNGNFQFQIYNGNSNKTDAGVYSHLVTKDTAGNTVYNNVENKSSVFLDKIAPLLVIAAATAGAGSAGVFGAAGAGAGGGAAAVGGGVGTSIAPLTAAEVAAGGAAASGVTAGVTGAELAAAGGGFAGLGGAGAALGSGAAAAGEAALPALTQAPITITGQAVAGGGSSLTGLGASTAAGVGTAGSALSSLSPTNFNNLSNYVQANDLGGGLDGDYTSSGLGNSSLDKVSVAGGGTVGSGALNASGSGLLDQLKNLTTGNSTVDNTIKNQIIKAGTGALTGSGGSGSSSGGTGGGLGGLLGGNGDIGGLIRSLYDLYANKKASDQISPALDKLNHLYEVGTPEANQLQKELDARDAAAGRRSQYGTRAVELRAKLADSQARLLSSPGYLNLNQAYAQNSTGGIAGLLAQLTGGGSGGSSGGGILNQIGNAAVGTGSNWLSSLFGGSVQQAPDTTTQTAIKNTGTSLALGEPNGSYNTSWLDDYIKNSGGGGVTSSTPTSLPPVDSSLFGPPEEDVGFDFLKQQSPTTPNTTLQTNPTTERIRNPQASPQQSGLINPLQQTVANKPSPFSGENASTLNGLFNDPSKGQGMNLVKEFAKRNPSSPDKGDAYYLIPGISDYDGKRAAVQGTLDYYKQYGGDGINPITNKKFVDHTFDDVWNFTQAHSQDYWKNITADFNAGKNPTTKTTYPGIT